MAYLQKLEITFVKTYAMHISWSSFRLGDSSGISNRGAKAKTITSYDNAFVTATTIVLTVRKRSDSNNKCFICAKAKRQRQSAQLERKSTVRYDDPFFNKSRFSN